MTDALLAEFSSQLSLSRSIRFIVSQRGQRAQPISTCQRERVEALYVATPRRVELNRVTRSCSIEQAAGSDLLLMMIRIPDTRSFYEDIRKRSRPKSVRMISECHALLYTTSFVGETEFEVF